MANAIYRGVCNRTYCFYNLHNTVLEIVYRAAVWILAVR